VVLHDFPAGTRAGQLIHEVLEHLDFQASDPAVWRAPVTSALERFGFDDHWAEPLCRALADIVATPLDGGTPPFRLRDIPPGRRLNELEFLFPVADSADEQRGLLTRERLATVLEHHAIAPLPAERAHAYAQRVRALGFTPLSGFLRGFIDLAFEHGGRWFVVDYKSNHLGPRAHDYRMRQLIGAMTEHHYFLQYHLYTVALHRHLTRRLRGYDYDRNFGGVYYLFLRGMAPVSPRGNGVFWDRPSRRLIEDLSAVLAGHPEVVP